MPEVLFTGTALITTEQLEAAGGDLQQAVQTDLGRLGVIVKDAVLVTHHWSIKFPTIPDQEAPRG